jgi:hypothetical protein
VIQRTTAEGSILLQLVHEIADDKYVMQGRLKVLPTWLYGAAKHEPLALRSMFPSGMTDIFEPNE